MEHHQIRALLGQTKQTAKNGMLMEDAHGVVEIVLLSTEINSVVNQIRDVHGQLLIVRGFEHMISHHVNHTVVVLGAIAEEIARDLMK